jgi:hypothetical protein
MGTLKAALHRHTKEYGQKKVTFRATANERSLESEKKSSGGFNSKLSFYTLEANGDTSNDGVFGNVEINS